MVRRRTLAVIVLGALLSACGQQSLYAGASASSPARTQDVEASPIDETRPTGTGLNAGYFSEMAFTGRSGRRTVPGVDFDWKMGSPDSTLGDDTFSARYSGELNALASGTYTFGPTAADGARLKVAGQNVAGQNVAGQNVAGQNVVGDFTDHASYTATGTVDLQAGEHVPLELDHHENSGLASRKLEWSGPGVSRQVVPASALFAKATTPPAGLRRVSYTKTLENFPNPERGFAFENDVAWPAQTPWAFCTDPSNDFSRYTYAAWNAPLTPEFLRRERAQGRSVVASRYHIADFRNRDLTPQYLDFLQRDFGTARAAGIKLSLRFAYNYPKGGPDAPLNVILRHIGQLKPLLSNNADVIAYMAAGFVGCWGEWHHSSNGLSGEGTPMDGHLTDPERQILGALLAALPRERMVVMRYPRQKFEYFGSRDFVPIAPLTAAQAFGGSERSRIGHQEDCFVCGESHGGSYLNPRGDLNEIPRFLEQENRYVVQEGEPGSPESISPDVPGNPNSRLASCPVVLEELRSKFWSVMGLFDLGSKASVIDRWKRDGCYGEIARRLGYRFRLLDAELPNTVRAGRMLSAKLVMTNDGFANLYNPRRLELVLRAKSGGRVSRIGIYDDARLKLPTPGETRTLKLGLKLPANLAPGRYELLLALPDPAPSLRNRPEYAVRLANAGVWEESTGLNSLGQMLEVLP